MKKVQPAEYAKGHLQNVRRTMAVPSPGGEGQDEGEPKHHFVNWIRFVEEHSPSPRPSPQGEGESFSVPMKIRVTFLRCKRKSSPPPIVRGKNLRFAMAESVRTFSSHVYATNCLLKASIGIVSCCANHADIADLVTGQQPRP
jgi:hypothetical protein